MGAQGSTRKEDEGLKEHSKGGRVRKHTTLDGRGLESALERRYG